MNICKRTRLWHSPMRMAAALALACFMPLFLGCGGGSGQPAATGTITGHVEDNANNSLSGATITAAGLSTVTDSNGNFTLTSVPVSGQTVSASLAGYTDDGRGSTIAYVKADQQVSAGDLILVPVVGNEAYLTDLTPRDNSGVAFGTATLGGTAYTHSLFGTADYVHRDAITYNLLGQYSRLRAKFGVRDAEANPDAVASIGILGNNGASLYSSGNVGLGQVVDIDIDVSGQNYLAIHVGFIIGDSATNDVDWALADPVLVVK